MELVRKLRLDAKLTVQEVAEATGLDQRTLNAWESGDQKDARVSKLGALAQHYGLTLTDLLIETPQAAPQKTPAAPALATA